MGLIAELKRRNVIRVGVAYLVASWLLIEVSTLILDVYNAPGWVSQVIVALLAVGFPVALVFAWAFEITPEGIKRESNVDRTQSITHTTAKRLDVVTIVMVVLASALLVGDRLISPGGIGTPASGASADGRASIAVLPFVNMSADPANEYFSDGLTETLLHMLAQVDDLRVAARTSAFAFKGTNTDIREIAARLDVATVLEGSVQKAGERVRITAQLIDATTGSHLWSGNYDRNLDDIFAIQDEIANAVAAELMASLLGGNIERRVQAIGTRSTAAYDLYLRGLERRAVYSYTSLPEAVRLFHDAIAEDPGFDDARLALAGTQLDMLDTGLVQPADAAANMRSALAPVLARQPMPPLAAGYAAYMELLSANFALDPAQRASVRQRLEAALARAPDNPELLDLTARFLGRIVGAADVAMPMLEHALELDPLNTRLMATYGLMLSQDERFDDALAIYARMREIRPGDSTGWVGPAWVSLDRGEFADAVMWLAASAQADRRDHEIPAQTAEILMRMGLDDEATPWLRRAELLNATGDDTRRVAIQHAYLTGDHARALEIAEQIVRARNRDRRGLYRLALTTYLLIMHERGELDAALAMVESVSPGMTAARLSRAPRDAFDVAVVTTVPFFTAVSEAPAARAARAETRERAIREFFPRFEPDDLFRATQAMIAGDLEAARRLYVAELRNPGGPRWYWRAIHRTPVYAEVVAHPEVRAVLADVERRLAVQAERYREYVDSGEITVP